MRTAKSLEPVRFDEAEAGDVEEGDERYEIFRVDCPECGQSIALFAEEPALPQHALCPTRWNPFGLTVCPGSARPAADAAPTAGAEGAQEEELAALLTLPAGLDWRRQPFSHVGGPGTRPVGRAVPAARA
ncbi:hypothetical protein RM572_25960 [Streptomyces sp. DSM 42041]|uniref:Uncharacterized protein n=1 Tax=Streptomyces hazeniae TaxID=3075538 RepID=A0ABU2NYZ6_9ACTN|nr:hypothetical protein [Streptomyces sp. DSM 42041]MDT0382209.1 hypothetical protein [Streptomyces sp. DSM 42041]